MYKRQELVELGAAHLVDADIEKIKSSFSHFRTNSDLDWRPIFGDGKAAEFICDEIVKHFGKG